MMRQVRTAVLSVPQTRVVEVRCASWATYLNLTTLEIDCEFYISVNHELRQPPPRRKLWQRPSL
jgi:hypothetical protein